MGSLNLSSNPVVDGVITLETGEPSSPYKAIGGISDNEVLMDINMDYRIPGYEGVHRSPDPTKPALWGGMVSAIVGGGAYGAWFCQFYPHSSAANDQWHAAGVANGAPGGEGPYVVHACAEGTDTRVVAGDVTWWRYAGLRGRHFSGTRRIDPIFAGYKAHATNCIIGNVADTYSRVFASNTEGFAVVSDAESIGLTGGSGGTAEGDFTIPVGQVWEIGLKGTLRYNGTAVVTQFNLFRVVSGTEESGAASREVLTVTPPATGAFVPIHTTTRVVGEANTRWRWKSYIYTTASSAAINLRVPEIWARHVQ